MILPAQPLVIVERLGEEDLVARAAELVRAVHFRLQERALMKRRLRLHQLIRHPLQERRLAEGKRIVRALFDRVVGVSARTIDRNDAVTHRAGDARAAERIIRDVVRGVVPLRIFKRAREEWHWIVAARAETRILHTSILLERFTTRLAHTCCVERVVERTRRMHRMRPRMHHIGVALEAVLIRHQALGRNESARRSLCERWLEVARAIFRNTRRALGKHDVRERGDHRDAGRNRCPPRTNRPLDATARESVQNKEPCCDEWRDDMHPVHDLARRRLADADRRAAKFHACQCNARREQNDRCDKGRDTRRDRTRIRTVGDVAPVECAEHDRWNHDREPEHEVREEVDEVEAILERLAGLPLQERHSAEVDTIDRQQREQPKHRGKKPLQFRTNRWAELRHLRTLSTAHRPPIGRVRIFSIAAGFEPGSGSIVSPSFVKRSMSLHQPRTSRM